MLNGFISGYLNGLMLGRLTNNSNGGSGGVEFRDISHKTEPILKYIKKNPYCSLQEIAEKTKIRIPEVNGILMKLLKEGKINRTQEHKYCFIEK